MKLSFYLEKLQSSEEYSKLLDEHQDAYVSAGFFVLDLESGNNTHQIDLYLPKEDKVAAFTLDSEVQVKKMDLMHSTIPQKLDLGSLNVQLENLNDLIEIEMKSRSLDGSISKIIAVIQNIGGKPTWSLSCVLSGLNILRATLLDESKLFEKMDKSSIMNFVKGTSPKDLKKN